MNGNIEYADLLNWAKHYGINANGSFPSPTDAEQLLHALASHSFLFCGKNDMVRAAAKKVDIEWNMA